MARWSPGLTEEHSMRYNHLVPSFEAIHHGLNGWNEVTLRLLCIGHNGIQHGLYSARGNKAPDPN